MVNKHGKGLKCAICGIKEKRASKAEWAKVCINCYFKYSDEIPEYVPFEQHDIWIINYYKKQQKGTEK
jgi:hypothetical protein